MNNHSKNYLLSKLKSGFLEKLIGILMIPVTAFLYMTWEYSYNNFFVKIPPAIKYIGALALLVIILVLISKVRSLIVEKEKLKGTHKKEIADLKRKYNPDSVSEIELKILNYLYRNSDSTISPYNIMSSIKLNPENKSTEYILYYLEKLKSKNMVSSRKIATFDETKDRYWSIAQKGREYIINQKHKRT